MPKSVKVRIKCLNHRWLITDEEMDNLIEALEAEQIKVIPHAKWETIIEHFKETLYGCSNCKYIFVTRDGESPKENGMNFCPKCGAQMDKE